MSEELKSIEECPCDYCSKSYSGQDDDEKIMQHDLNHIFEHNKRTHCSRRRSYINMFASEGVFHSHIYCSYLEKTLKLPKNVRLFKYKARDKFCRYKKAECERRRRYANRRKTIFTKSFIKQTCESRRLQKKIDYEMKHGEDERRLQRLLKKKADLLEAAKYTTVLTEAMQDLTMRCENCKKLYLRVNLFWGVSLCDICYFDTDVIQNIMSNYSAFCEPKKSRFHVRNKKAVEEDRERTSDEEEDNEENENENTKEGDKEENVVDDELYFDKLRRSVCENQVNKDVCQRERILHRLTLVKNRQINGEGKKKTKQARKKNDDTDEDDILLNTTTLSKSDCSFSQDFCQHETSATYDDPPTNNSEEIDMKEFENYQKVFEAFFEEDMKSFDVDAVSPYDIDDLIENYL